MSFAGGTQPLGGMLELLRDEIRRSVEWPVRRPRGAADERRTGANIPMARRKHPTIQRSIDPTFSEQAFVTAKSEIDAVPEDALIHINIDIPLAAMIALRAAPRLEAMLRVAAKLPDFDTKHITRLRTYAAAAWHAHVMATPAKNTRLQALVREGTKLKKAMLLGADALAVHGLVSAARVAEVRAGSGYLDLANDMVALGQLYADAWTVIVNKTAITEADVERAKVLGLELLMELGTQREGSTEASLRLRAQAFTLFVDAYDQCRRAAIFLRWNLGDHALVAPSIYVRRRRRPVDPTEPTEPTEVSAPVPEQLPEGPTELALVQQPQPLQLPE